MQFLTDSLQCYIVLLDFWTSLGTMRVAAKAQQMELTVATMASPENGEIDNIQ